MNKETELTLKSLKIIIEKLTNRGEEYPEVCQEIEEFLNPEIKKTVTEKTHDGLSEDELKDIEEVDRISKHDGLNVKEFESKFGKREK